MERSSKRTWLPVALAILVLALSLVLGARPAAADTTYSWDGDDTSISETDGTITISGSGTLTLSSDTEANIVIESGSGEVTIDLGGCTLTGLGTDSVVKSTESTVTLENGTVTGGSADNGGGVYVFDGSFAMAGVTISDCSASSYGGGVYVRSADFTMDSSSTITGCSGNSGGGICVRYGESHTTTINGGTITNCTATKDGGGVYLFGSSSPTLVVNGGSITGCTSQRDTKGGGAIRACTGSVVTLVDATITGNTSNANGGAIYADGSTVTQSGGSITGNTAAASGGGVYMTTGDSDAASSFTATDGAVLAGNTASTSAADVYCASTCSVSLSEVNSSVEYEETGHMIDGWYEDTSDSRYAYSSNITAKVSSTDSGTEYFLIAARGIHTDADAVVENEVAATCTEDGSYDSVVYCSDCGVELSRETVVVEATGHSYVATEVVEATCTEDGYTVYTCENDESHTYTTVESATGHSWGEPTEDDVEWADDYSSCTLTLTCTVCGETVQVALEVTSETDEDGNTVYTATGYYDGLTYTVTATVAAEDVDEDEQDEDALAQTGDSAAAAGTLAVAGAALVTVGAIRRRRSAK